MDSYSSKNRFQIMTYDQVGRLTKMLSDNLEIVTSDNESITNTNLCLKSIIEIMKQNLRNEDIDVDDVKLIGGAATYIIDETADIYSDIDILFCLNNCSSLSQMDHIRSVVMNTLNTWLFGGHDDDINNIDQSNNCNLFTKQVCVPVSSNEFWSLFSLGTPLGDVVEFKFSTELNQRRHFECSVDAFQIALDPVLSFLGKFPEGPSRSFYPLTTIECVWGCVKTAMTHLHERIVHIARPDQLRGGGLLKFCKLLACGFSVDQGLDSGAIERLMCSRFFIDFPDLDQQNNKIVQYLLCHFPTDNQMYISFLEHLSSVILSSSSYSEVNKVQLGNHIRDLTLDLRQTKRDQNKSITSPSSSTITSCSSSSLFSQASSSSSVCSSLSLSSSSSSSNIRFAEFDNLEKWSVAEINIVNNTVAKDAEEEEYDDEYAENDDVDDERQFYLLSPLSCNPTITTTANITSNHRRGSYFKSHNRVSMVARSSSRHKGLDVNSCSSSIISTPSETSHDNIDCLSEDNA